MSRWFREGSRYARSPSIENAKHLMLTYLLLTGTDGVRIVVPMGDLVTPLELHERAEAATTQEEHAAIHEEARAHKKWAKAEFERRWRAMVLEAPINPKDSMRANIPRWSMEISYAWSRALSAVDNADCTPRSETWDQFK